MNIIDIIEKKKNKKILTKEEINYVVNEYTNGNIFDYQMASLLMAIVINGMNERETTYLTLAMASSGEHMDLSQFKKNTVDKHSTGGIGDKTTLIVTPIVASLDCKVAKMSGRSLGYTGGTIDKLESISGYQVELSEEQFFKQVNKIGLSLISQTKNIAPADKKIYALRDVTSTVESIPLIASSIMSKKIASGASNLVLDVKVGSGAFMKNKKDASALANLMVKIGKSCKINTMAILTNMDEPLGNNIGNILEVMEAIDVLKGKGPEDLREVCFELAAQMVCLTKKNSYKKAKQQVLEVINNGLAYTKFNEWITNQGGDLSSLDLQCKYKIPVLANKNGYITKMNAEQIGKTSVLLGSGRMNKEDNIDYNAGIILNYKVGNKIKKGDLLATLYTSKKIDEKIKQDFLNSFEIKKNKPNKKPLIIKKII